ncbi:FHIPEP family type III secretion protein [Salinarimonas chemoclinalis]|uniref:FHIPEP family type III secretion protein n=1 Tax=Salinarimonas chemoclinalis TaxID=3241599 RepID=UPI003555CD79
MRALDRFLAQAAKRQDLVFAVFFVLIVAMLVLPLPTLLIDALLAVNLTLSLVVLITATYLRHPLDLSTFPAIILMTSVMRVALSVATTRLILATGDPGELIVAFGEFVIAGNIVVGLVIFLIIAVVQFMVVTKGAERISEVSARFTLDALPGKQMSIDSDVRSGDITAEEAREKRRTLQLEMQFHGAMDGAMRFVKGDAIAGLIIVFINLVGGMTIGMLQRGLDAGEAGRLYVLLSVGDGLIAQIPAMFIALAAGTIVTRVTTEKDSDLGRDITRQLGAEPKAIAVGAVVAAAMGFIPGFPTMVFLILAAVLGGIAWAMLRPRRAHAADADASPAERGSGAATGAPPAAGAAEGTGADAPSPAPAARAGLAADELPLREAQPGDIIVIYGDPVFLDKLRPNAAYVHVERTKQMFLRRMGFSAPSVGYVYEPALGRGEVVIHIDDVPVERFTVPDVLEREPLEDAQARLYAEELSRVRLRFAASLFGVPEVTQWLKDVEPACGRLATDIQQLMPLMTLVDTLRRLLDDGVGLVPPRLVLEGLAQSSQRGQDPDVISEAVRGFLRRQISHAAADGEQVINALVLSPETEATIRRSAGPEAGPVGLRNAEETVRALVDAVRASVEENAAPGTPLSLMTPADLRRPARRLLKQHRVDLPVLSFTDVAPDYQVRTVGVVGAARAAA